MIVKQPSTTLLRVFQGKGSQALWWNGEKGVELKSAHDFLNTNAFDYIMFIKRKDENPTFYPNVES